MLTLSSKVGVVAQGVDTETGRGPRAALTSTHPSPAVPQVSETPWDSVLVPSTHTCGVEGMDVPGSPLTRYRVITKIEKG